jgi:hypothetical protein
VFQSVHNLWHPGTKATAKLVAQRFVWPGIQKDCRTWAWACQVCQRSKVHRHTARFHAAGSPFSSYSRRPNRTASNVNWFHILSHCSRALHTMARSQTSQPKPWHAPSSLAGYPASAVRRHSPSTRDVSLSPNSSTPWPNYVVSNFPARPLITLPPTDS